MTDVVKVDIFMPWYIQDYERDTADLSFEEHGFYTAIMRSLWSNRGRLATDRDRLARVLRTDITTLDRLWYIVERFTYDNGDGTFSQKRLSFELEKAKGRKARATTNGKKGGRPSVLSQGSLDFGADLEPNDEAKTEPKPKPKSNPEESSSPSPSQEDPLSPVREARLWSAESWLRKFKVAWASHRPETGTVFYGDAGDGKGCTNLERELEKLPEDARVVAQGRADEMFREFMGSADPRTVERRHPFVFFAQAFGALRVPALSIGSRAPPRGPHVGFKSGEVEERTSGEVNL